MSLSFVSRKQVNCMVMQVSSVPLCWFCCWSFWFWCSWCTACARRTKAATHLTNHDTRSLTRVPRTRSSSPDWQICAWLSAYWRQMPFWDSYLCWVLVCTLEGLILAVFISHKQFTQMWAALVTNFCFSKITCLMSVVSSLCHELEWILDPLVHCLSLIFKVLLTSGSWAV